MRKLRFLRWDVELILRKTSATTKASKPGDPTLKVTRMLRNLQLLSFFGVLASCAAFAGLFILANQIIFAAESATLYTIPFIGTYRPTTAWTILLCSMSLCFLFGLFFALNLHPIQGVESKLPDSEIPSAGIRTAQPMTPASPPPADEKKPVKIRSI